MPSEVTVHYPFHPLVNRTLSVVRWPRRAGQAVTVLDPDGVAMKIPLWMLQAQAAHIETGEQILLPGHVLLELVELFDVHGSRMSAHPQRDPETEHEAAHLCVRTQRIEPT